MLSESSMPWVLLIMVLLPLVGAGVVLSLAEHGIGLVRRTALLSVLATFALSVLVVGAYDPTKQDSGPEHPELLQMRLRDHLVGDAQNSDDGKTTGRSRELTARTFNSAWGWTASTCG